MDFRKELEKIYNGVTSPVSEFPPPVNNAINVSFSAPALDEDETEELWDSDDDDEDDKLDLYGDPDLSGFNDDEQLPF